MRVVVTGMGVITPIGKTVNDFWEAVKAGKCGIDFIKSFDTEGYACKIAAEVLDFEAADYIEKKEARRMDRFTHFALAASIEAVKNAELKTDELNAERFGVIYGSGIGGITTIEREHTTLLTKGIGRVSPFFIPMLIPNMAAGNIAIQFGAKGPCECVVTACATGTSCIGNAFRLLKHGYADVILAGGSEAAITPMAVAGFIAITALSKSSNPLRASIPFDAERDGFIMGEGGGTLVMETLEHAMKRNAPIVAEVIGYGSTCDAYHITAPAPEGAGSAQALKLAIAEGGIAPSDVSYINAHGTSTLYNDKFETMAIKTVFGDDAYKIPVSSSKSMFGHLLGAAGTVEAIVTINALLNGFVPPTIGYKVPDPELDLDYVPNVGRKQNLNYAISNSLGFGGHNAALLFKKWEG